MYSCIRVCNFRPASRTCYRVRISSVRDGATWHSRCSESPRRGRGRCLFVDDRHYERINTMTLYPQILSNAVRESLDCGETHSVTNILVVKYSFTSNPTSLFVNPVISPHRLTRSTYSLPARARNRSQSTLPPCSSVNLCPHQLRQLQNL